ncbi:MAG: hypothetical protein IKO47_04250 [Ruminococcus sp.]|nr:hypothetical protein [Ruminococcus sp.]
MTGTDELCTALLRRHRTYRFRTSAGRALFIAVIAIALIVVAVTNIQRSRGKKISRRTGIIILAVFIIMNVGVVIIDGALAE